MHWAKYGWDHNFPRKSDANVGGRCSRLSWHRLRPAQRCCRKRHLLLRLEPDLASMKLPIRSSPKSRLTIEILRMFGQRADARKRRASAIQGNRVKGCVTRG